MRLQKECLLFGDFSPGPFRQPTEDTDYVASLLKSWPKVGTDSGERWAGAAL